MWVRWGSARPPGSASRGTRRGASRGDTQLHGLNNHGLPRRALYGERDRFARRTRGGVTLWGIKVQLAK